MPCSFNCVVAVTTIQFQLAVVQLVTKRNRLFGLVSNIDDRWMDGREQTGRQVATYGDRCSAQDKRKLVNPSREMKLLHSIHQNRTTSARI